MSNSTAPSDTSAAVLSLAEYEQSLMSGSSSGGDVKPAVKALDPKSTRCIPAQYQHFLGKLV